MRNPRELRVLMLHNVISPYRLPVFEELGRHIALSVWFCKARTRDRLWDSSLEGYALRARVLPSFPVGPFFINYSILYQLLRHRYDVYVVGDFPEMAFATFVTMAVAKIRRKPVVLWSETLDHEVNIFQNLVVSRRRRDQMIRRGLTKAVTGYRRLLHRGCDRFVALSGLAREFLIGEGINPELIDSGIQVMPAALLPPPSVAKNDGPYRGCRTILYLGYLNPAKGIDSLIRVARLSPDPKLRLLIAGTGPAEESLRREAAGDPRIEFLGYVEGQAKADLFAWADVFVLPTLVDCWAMVINEAFHYGVPVITTTAAGAAELLGDRDGGLVVPPRNDFALQVAVNEVLGNPALRRKMARYGKKRHDVTDPSVGARPLIGGITKAGGAA